MYEQTAPVPCYYCGQVSGHRTDCPEYKTMPEEIERLKASLAELEKCITRLEARVACLERGGDDGHS